MDILHPADVPQDVADAAEFYTRQCSQFVVPMDMRGGAKVPMAKWASGRELELRELRRRCTSGGGIGWPLPKGVIVVDLDVDKVTGEQTGMNALFELMEQHHGQPSTLDTLTVYTPSGGAHLYYRCDPDLRVTNAGQLGKHIDLRCGPTGLVVLPPSKGSGFHGVYSWDLDGPSVMRPLPVWLGNAISETQQKKIDFGEHASTIFGESVDEPTAAGAIFLRQECSRVQSTEEGQRNNTLNISSYAVASAVRHGHVEKFKAASDLLEAALTSGLTYKDALKTIRSAFAAQGLLLETEEDSTNGTS